MAAGTNAVLHRRAYTLPGALGQPAGTVGAVGNARASDAGRGTEPAMASWRGWCVIAGVSPPIRRAVVVESDASIDGSLWYGDLPALDGARDDTHSPSSPSECKRRPEKPRSPR